MGELLTDRGKQILEAIIEDYIATAEPIGSRAISRRHPISLSSATVRNVMADLEEMGYLASPHTSAGRVPTDKAYRFYVNSLMEVKRVTCEESEDIRRHCHLAGKDIADVLKETSRMLSATSHYMGVVIAPRFAANVLRHMEFLKLGSRKLLAILVSCNGTVQNKIIETEEELTPDDLVRMNNYLNGLLQGLTISQVRSRLMEEMHSDKIQYDALLSRALKLSELALEEEDTRVFVDGQANILEQPEFADVSRMKEIFLAFEKKSRLLELLDRSMQAEGVQIFIGAESRLNDIQGLSLITSTYMTGKNTLGVLGVIGPTRMGYAKVIPIVDYTAKLITRLLEMD